MMELEFLQKEVATLIAAQQRDRLQLQQSTALLEQKDALLSEQLTTIRKQSDSIRRQQV